MKLPYSMIAVVSLLAACSAETPPMGNDSAGQPTTAATPSPGASTSRAAPPPTVPGVVTEAAAARLKGELRCAFTDRDGAVRLAGAGDVDKASKATAVVIRDGAPVALQAAMAGGFDAMRLGGRFVGERLAVTVRRGKAQDTGNESSRNAATLNFELAGEPASSIEGLWECGP